MFFVFFFFQAEDGIRDYKVTGVQTCALPICVPDLGVDDIALARAALAKRVGWVRAQRLSRSFHAAVATYEVEPVLAQFVGPADRKSTRLNSSHLVISYAVFCLKKKKQVSLLMYI